MELFGKGVSAGIAMAQIRYSVRTALDAPYRKVEDTKTETKRYFKARDAVLESLERLVQDSKNELGEEGSQLFSTYQIMLKDDDISEEILELIATQGTSAEYAVCEVARKYINMFATMADPYMSARAQDVEDILTRVVENMMGVKSVLAISEPTILVSDQFSPTDVARFDRSLIVGLIASEGSENSHTAIFARQIGIPAVISVGREIFSAFDGDMAAIDGSTGEVQINPDEPTARRFLKRYKEWKDKQREITSFRDVPCITKKGKRIRIFANIGGPDDVEAALNNGAEGIGLFRSEFLFLGRSNLPEEETQYRQIRKVVEGMMGRPVIIRTIDIGSDKCVPGITLAPEENPALGVRGIRLCMKEHEIFKTHLRAVLRAAYHGPLEIMFPMVCTVEEFMRARSCITEAARTLEQEGVPHNADIPVGVMIETPASVIISNQLAKVADFFSIGTNDLTQYAFAADRMNDSKFLPVDAEHSIILSLIKMAVESAHQAGIWVGVCGELAADEAVIEKLLATDIDELSVSPHAILPLKKRITSQI